MGRDTIRIRDLANPVLTDLQVQAIASAPPVTMTEQAVLDAARKRTGLDDFGSEDFLDRLRVWLASFEEDSGLRSARARDHVRRGGALCGEPAARRGR